ncbi:MAG TPA: T9SS type A sorting domain-containing protein, partial [Bacteroidota bacterium]
LTDTAGNQSIKILRNLPDDQFIDNTDASYTEERGSWSTSTTKVWGVDSRSALLSAADTARVRWSPLITRSGRYNVFLQVPAVANMAGNIHLRFFSNGSLVDSAFLAAPLPGSSWVFVGNPSFTAGAGNSIVMEVAGTGQAGKVAVADVIKISPLVRERQLVVSPSLQDLGSVSEGDTLRTTIQLSNQGSGPLRVSGVTSSRPGIQVPMSFPLDLQPMQSAALPLTLTAPSTGTYRDSILIASDDPLRPLVPVLLLTHVEPYFALADNDDTLAYHEAGTWSYSNAQAFGKTSRYALLSDPANPSATFTVQLKQTAAYDLQEIVPKTVNAATRALYTINADARLVDTVVIDQNSGSGSWVRLGQYNFAAGTQVTITVRKAAGSGGDVLRADAVKVAKVVTTAAAPGSPAGEHPLGFSLSQNYPNPFNPSTTIRFGLPERSRVVLTVSNMLGQQVARLVDGELGAGYHEIRFDASGLASGVYFYQLRAGGFVQSKRFLLLR